MHFSPRFEMFGLVFDIPTILMIVVTSLVVFFLILGLTRNWQTGVPSGAQNFLEWVIEFIEGIAGGFMEKKTAAKYVTLGLTLFLYIFIGNQLGLLFNVNVLYKGEISESLMNMLTLSGTEEAVHQKHEIITEELHSEHGLPVAFWKSPTAAPSVTFALALMVLLYAHYLSIKKGGVGKYFKHYFEPHPLMFFLHAMEEFIIKPLTMPLRLFGNIFAGEVLIAVLLSAGAAVIALPIWLGYSVFVGAVQAYIFTTLTMVYISQKVNDEH
ncbi:F0F1 ATP synthase subunit A [Brevibacillus sp. SYSU BS000544]|uniref:F0F1 ATP synthase subunit A n=1 Tax=Brevibacillus sp. SYSU BS000544 TaxID=3416443 RepID=UPI003CE4CC5D